jgi:LysM repeat protein
MKKTIIAPATLLIIVLALISLTGKTYAASSTTSISANQLSTVLNKANSLIETTPYIWGAATPYVGMDCSSFTMWAYNQAGITIPRNSQDQFEQAGTSVSRDQLIAGDLVFFTGTAAESSQYITHVGMYVGNGNFIEESSVYNNVVVKPLWGGYYEQHYYGAKRIIKATTPTATSGTYIIQAGDTFWILSQKLGIPLTSLMNANPNVSIMNLNVGQTIKLP